MSIGWAFAASFQSKLCESWFSGAVYTQPVNLRGKRRGQILKTSALSCWVYSQLGLKLADQPKINISSKFIQPISVLLIILEVVSM